MPRTTSQPRRPVSVAVGVLVAGALAGCSLVVPDEAVDAARAQWNSLPDDARTAVDVVVLRISTDDPEGIATLVVTAR